MYALCIIKSVWKVYGDVKSVDELAKSVIRREYSSGETRKTALGSKCAAAQKRVNNLLK